MVEPAAVPEAEEDAPPKGKSKGLLVAIAGAVVAGGLGFFASFGGFLDGFSGGGASGGSKSLDVHHSFVPLETMIISLGPEAEAQNLKFTAELEVEPGTEKAVEGIKPRILDVLNSYLRAVDEAELADPAALALLRAQMLRRIQIVVGDGVVRDLLIVEFVLN